MRIIYGIQQTAPNNLLGKYDSPLRFKVAFLAFSLEARGTHYGTKVNTFANSCTPLLINELWTWSYAHWNEVATFNKEVRFKHKLQSATVRVPAGYIRPNNLIEVALEKWQATDPTMTGWIPVPLSAITGSEDWVTHDSIFTIDFTQMYDYTWNGSQPGITYNSTTGLLSNGKYPIGDDGAGANIRMTLVATSAITGTTPTIGGTMYYLNTYGTPQSATIQPENMNYTGPTLYLETSPQMVYVNSQQLSLSSVKIQNSSGTLTDRNVWLYVKGNVENASLTDGSTTINGQGVDNNWLYIGDLTPLQMKNYRLNFDYKGKNTCGVNDTIVVFTAFDAVTQNGSWNPNITYPIDSVNICNRGVYQYTILDSESPRAKIAGRVAATIPNTANPSKANYLHYENPYYVTWQIDGRVSQGALNDPYVVMTVPAGQIYVDTTTAYGAAQFEYPLGTWNPIPAAVLTKIQNKFGATSNHTQNRTDTIHAKDLIGAASFMMPGWGSDPSLGFTDSMRVMNIRIPFIPDCETELFGLRFSGIFHGNKSCGDPVEDNGMIVFSHTIYPDVLPEYSFQVTLKNLDMTNRFYTPDHNEDYFIATFHKDLGAVWIDNVGKPIQNGDYIRLRMPVDLKINGPIISPEFGAINIIGSSTGVIDANGDRIYQLELPIQQLNDSMLFFMDSMTFSYHIPFLFTPNPLSGCASPKEEIVCQVMTNVNFAPGVCANRPASIGSGELLLLTTSLVDATFIQCINMPARLTIACAGVTPVWYRDALGTGGELGHNNYYDYTPISALPDTFWIRGVYDYGGQDEEDFGVAHVIVRKYPQVKPNFSADTVCFGSATTLTNLSTIGGIPSSIGNTRKWYWYKDGEATPFDSIQNPQIALSAGNHSIRLYIISTDGCVADTSIQILVNTLPVPTVAGITSICFRDTAVYYTGTGMSNYTWSVNNGTIVSYSNNQDSVLVCWNISSGFDHNGTVYVNYNDANGCRAAINSKLENIIIRDLPTIPVILGADTVCINATERYVLGPQTEEIRTFVWSLNGGGTVTSRTDTSFIHVNWTALGSHELTLAIASRFGCAADSIGKLQVVVRGPVSPVISGADTVCSGTTGEVYSTAAGMQSYTWTVQGGNIVSGQSTNSISVDWTTANEGYVSVEITDALGCSDTSNRFSVYVRGTFSISCPANQLVMLPGSKSDTLISNLGTPNIIYSKIPSTFIDADVVYNNNSSGIFGRGVNRVIWIVRDNRCPNVNADSCEQLVVVNMPLCGINDTVWQINGSFTIDNSGATVTDYDGNTYDVVRIGCNCWVKENMRSENYADGTAVSPTPAIYQSSKYGNATANLSEFGRLYTYDAATRNNTSQGICPNGWHIPALTEWECVMNNYSSKQVKMNGAGYWLGETGISNSSNFGAKPAGYYDNGRGYRLLGDTWFWMYDPVSSGPTKLSCHLFFGCPEIISDSIDKGWGVSVRCVKD